MKTTLAAGTIALVIAIVFLGLLAMKVPSIPLWIVVGLGVAAMVVSVVEEVRADRDRVRGS